MLVPKFTEDFRKREIERARRSLFYFGFSVLGFTAKDPDTGESQIGDIHRELCAFLEGRPPHHPWRRALVCASRGIAKSVWTTQTYPLWRGLYIPNFSTKIIENSSDNAKRNHFIPLVELFTTSPRADYLQWLYEHRIPSGFAGWTSEQIKLIQTDPLANPTLSYWGLESKFEGAHPDLVVLDDPEGADAAKSLAANEQAWHTYQISIPLLKHPMRSQILVVATPHGDDPMVWKIRDRENWQGPEDNAHTEFKIFWRPVLNPDGTSAWPQRFPLDYIEALSREDIFDQQYMLRRTSGRITLFDMDVVLGDGADNPGSCYTSIPGRRAVLYPGFDYSPEQAANDPAYRLPKPELREADLSELRCYMHFDPLHRSLAMRRSSPRKQRPADAAIAVVGITPDFHPLVLEGWNANADIDDQITHLFSLYCKWCPILVTYEAVGAQAWLVSLVQSYERQYEHWRAPRSTEFLGASIELPRMSLRMVEADKTNESKEAVYREQLSSWVNRGVLHFHRETQHEFLYQLDHALDPSSAVDLIDCLAQGPAVWSPPLASDKRHRKYHEYVAKVNAKLAGATGVDVAGWMRRTSYTPPWQGRAGARTGRRR